MMNEKCRQLGDELAELKGLRDDFVREFELGKASGDLSGQELMDLKDVINALLKGDTEAARFREAVLPPQLKLKEQYESQVRVAWNSGLFEESLPGQVEAGKTSLPFIERKGQKYPMPTWKEVQKILHKPENREIIKEKSAQGFTQMLIVPFGYDLKTMCGKFKEKVRELDQTGLNADGSSNPDKGIFGVGGEKVEFKRDDDKYPVYIWDSWTEEQMVYYPKQYDQQNHGGKTKEDAIKINGAWQICFVEDLEKMVVIPFQSDDQKDVIGGRKRMDRKGSFIKGQTETPRIMDFKAALDDEQKLVNPKSYQHEKGFTPEKYLWMQLTSLLSKEKPILMDYESSEWRGAHLTQSYSVASDFVPFVGWSRMGRRVDLGGYGTDDRDDNYGVRSSVDIK